MAEKNQPKPGQPQQPPKPGQQAQPPKPGQQQPPKPAQQPQKPQTPPPPPPPPPAESEERPPAEEQGSARVVADTEQRELLPPLEHPHPGEVPPPREGAGDRPAGGGPVSPYYDPERRDPAVQQAIDAAGDAPERHPFTRGTQGEQELPRGTEIRPGVFDDSGPPAGVRGRPTAAVKPSGELDEENSPRERPMVGYDVPAARNTAPRMYRNEDGTVRDDAPHVAGGTVKTPTATPPMREDGSTDIDALQAADAPDRMIFGTVLPTSPEVVSHPDANRRQGWGSASDPTPSKAQEPNTATYKYAGQP